MDLQRARDWFEENFRLRGERGAAVSLWDAKGEVLSLAGGYEDMTDTKPWTVRTPVLIWSATKGPAAACCLHALGKAGLEPDDKVCSLWPEFAAAGKAEITYRMLLQHQAWKTGKRWREHWLSRRLPGFRELLMAITPGLSGF